MALGIQCKGTKKFAESQCRYYKSHPPVYLIGIIATIAEYFNIKQIHVSHKTVREGVVYSIIENDKNDNE